MINFFVSVCVLFLFADASWAASQAKSVKEGNALYFDGDYEGAIVKYNQALEKASESDIINFDVGTAYYKEGDYQSAVSHLQKSLLSEDPQLQGKAHYNLGNSYYKAGIAQENKNINAAITTLKQSLSHFETVLRSDEDDTDAKYNYDFVEEELKRLQEKKRQQKQEKQSQKSEDKQEQEKQDSEESQEGQQQEGQEKQESQSQQQDGQEQQGQSEQENQEEQEGQESQETEQAEEQQSAQGARQGDEASEDQESQNIQEAKDAKMSPEEVQMLLESYQQNEEPRGLLNFMKHKGKGVPVLKDW